MNEGKSFAIVIARARAADVRGDYEELRLLVDRLNAIVHHQNKECERLLNQEQPIKAEVALVWRVGHELLEQCLAELSVVRQRMGLRIDVVLATMEAAEARRPAMILKKGPR
nr:hypothetical protein [uncultured Roseococcus sp.]